MTTNDVPNELSTDNVLVDNSTATDDPVNPVISSTTADEEAADKTAGGVIWWKDCLRPRRHPQARSRRGRLHKDGDL